MDTSPSLETSPDEGRVDEGRAMAHVAVVGSYGVGLTMRLPRMPVAGETLSGGEFASGHGGKGSNQAVQAARLGAEVDLLTAVGADAMGQAARALWAGEGVRAHPVVVEDAATMAGVILVEPSGENRIVIASGALDHLAAADVDAFRGRLAEADIAVVSLEIPIAAAVHALQVAHAAGTRTLLNPAPASALPEETWRAVDILTPNATEAAILLGLDPDAAAGASPTDLARELHDRTGATVLLTCGGQGVVVCDEGGTTTVPAAPVRAVVDTTGAGDAFTAGVAVAIAEGADPVAAARFAARVGAYVVGHREVVPALPTRTELEGHHELDDDDVPDEHDVPDER